MYFQALVHLLLSGTPSLKRPIRYGLTKEYEVFKFVVAARMGATNRKIANTPSEFFC